jgi:hypothetical protein
MNPKFSPALSSNTSADKKAEVMEQYKKEQMELYIKELEATNGLQFLWSNEALKKLNARF